MGSIPVITVTGWSGSGKTTFMTEVVRGLTAAGIQVGCVKHHGHAPGGVDTEGKDSWKYAHAGANPVVLSSETQYAIFRTVTQEPSRDELIAQIADEVDMVLVEGFRAAADGAVEVCRKALGKGPKLRPEERIALISDDEELRAQVLAEGKPVFDLDDYDAVVTWMLEYVGLEGRNA